VFKKTCPIFSLAGCNWTNSSLFTFRIVSTLPNNLPMTWLEASFCSSIGRLKYCNQTVEYEIEIMQAKTTSDLLWSIYLTDEYSLFQRHISLEWIESSILLYVSHYHHKYVGPSPVVLLHDNKTISKHTIHGC